MVFNKDDRNIPKIKNSIGYSLKQIESKKIKKILKIPGQHNVSNALAALAVARILKIPNAVSFKALSDYKGSWRRFEIFSKRLKAKRYTLISDYGHHPNEILATLKAAREKYPKKKIWLIYQPHQYQRTYYLFNDFVKVFRQAPIDNIIITDIYDVAGREEKKISSNVSSRNLVKKINSSTTLKGGKKNVSYMKLDDAESYVKKNIKNGEALIIMGAGDVYKLVDRF